MSICMFNIYICLITYLYGSLTYQKGNNYIQKLYFIVYIWFIWLSLCLDVFGCLFWVFGQNVFLSVFAFLPQLNAKREYYAYIESLREHFLCKPNVPAPCAAYREGTLISRTLISSFYCIITYLNDKLLIYFFF